jgi:hypothetical protein
MFKARGAVSTHLHGAKHDEAAFRKHVLISAPVGLVERAHELLVHVVR